MRQATPEVRISHIGIAVSSIAEALPFYREILGMPEVELAPTDGARIKGLDAAGALVELLEAAEPDSPIAKFIGKRGPGIHHICFAVPDLDGALERCRAKGVRLIDEAPAWVLREKESLFYIPPLQAGS